MFEKKYTMEEFKKMFEEARKETLDDIESATSKANEDNGSQFSGLLLELTSSIAISMLETNLFHKEEK